MTTQLIIKALLSGALVVGIGELARRNNYLAAIVHSLPLISLLALIWLYTDTRDTALIARHAQGTFWFVLPTLPMFLALPWLLRRGVTFWPSLGLCALLTVTLYFITMRLLKAAGVQF
ncbi:MAG: DUF3147 family protein [Chthoniobacteraceae bacterium]